MSDAPSTPIDSAYWVVPDRFLAGEYPRSLDPSDAPAKLRAIVDAGVTLFVDLTEDGLLEPYSDILVDVGGGRARHRRFSIRDGSVPPDAARMREILDSIDDEIDGGGAVYLHCLGGIGRTGTVVGCWLARHGEPGWPALSRLRELWRTNPKSRWTTTPETREQERFILNWRE